MTLQPALQKLLLVFCILLCAACAQTPAAPASATATPPAAGTAALRIGVLPITDVVPFYIAQAQGYWKQKSLAVELVPVSSAAERDQLMAAAQIDGEVNDLVAAALFNAQTPRLQIVRKALQPSANAPTFFLLAAKDSPFKSALDLKGVEIGISQNSVIEYLTQRMLERQGLSPSDIKVTNVPAIPTRLQLLTQGQLKAATLPDPLGSLAKLQGARVILDDSQYPDYSQSVISFRSEILAQRPEEVRKFLAGYEQALQDIRTRPAQFRNILITQSRVPAPLQDKYQFPPFPEPSIPNQAQWDDVVQWALAKGLIKQAVSYDASVTAVFLR